MSKENFRLAFFIQLLSGVYPVLLCDSLSENEYFVKYWLIYCDIHLFGVISFLTEFPPPPLQLGPQELRASCGTMNEYSSCRNAGKYCNFCRSFELS